MSRRNLLLSLPPRLLLCTLLAGAACDPGSDHCDLNLVDKQLDPKTLQVTTRFLVESSDPTFRVHSALNVPGEIELNAVGAHAARTVVAGFSGATSHHAETTCTVDADCSGGFPCVTELEAAATGYADGVLSVEVDRVDCGIWPPDSYLAVEER